MLEQEKTDAESSNETLKYSGSVIYVDPSELEPFKAELKGEGKGAKTFDVTNPFKVPDIADDEDMQDLRKGIEEYGVLVPLTVRRRKDGKYELLSGYRRKKAVELINKEREGNPELEQLKLPIVELPDCDTDHAIEVLTTSNTYRKNISLIERVRACGLAYIAMRRKNRYSEETKGRAAEVVGKMFDLSPKQVERYASLLNLNDELLRMVCREDVIKDGKKISYKTTDGKVKLPRRSGEILSTLGKSQQKVIFDFLQSDDAFIHVSMAAPVKTLFRGKPDLNLTELRNYINDRRKSSKEDFELKNEAELESKVEPESENTEISLNNLQSYFKDEIPQKIRDKVHSLFTKWREAGSPENFEIKSTDQQAVEGSTEA